MTENPHTNDPATGDPVAPPPQQPPAEPSAGATGWDASPPPSDGSYASPPPPPPYYAAGQPGTPQPWGPAPSGSPMTPNDERLWATLSHALSLVSAWVALGFIAPLVVMAVFGNRSAYVRHHAVESLNFQITALIVTVVGVVVGILTLGLGFLVLGAYGIFYFVVVILASVKANSGEWYRYPLSLRLVR